MRRLISGLLVVAIALSVNVNLTGCNDKSNESLRYDIYSTFVTDKVMRDIDPDEELRQVASFSVDMAKGENEAAQVIINPETNVNKCLVSVGEIKNSNGDVLDSENIDVYYQQYIEITNISKNQPGEFGWYPDMLLPYDAAVINKINYINAGDNQGIFINFDIPTTQPTGVYTGEVTITLDNEKVKVPVSVNVRDIVLPEQKTLKNIMNTTCNFCVHGELDSSMEMQTKYYEFMLDYSLTTRIPIHKSSVQESYVDAIRKYYDEIVVFDVLAEGGASNWVEGKLHESIISIAKACFEDGRNYFEKGMTWLYSVDEASGKGVAAQEAASARFTEARQIINDSADEVLAMDVVINGNLTKETVVDSIRALKLMMTDGYSEIVQNVNVWCTSADAFNTDAYRYNYENIDAEHWFYTVNGSYHPSANYHIDDPNNFMSSRSLGWMCMDYDASGILYYETNFQVITSFEGGTAHFVHCDPYTDAMRFPYANGDGWLLYPGAKYGVYGPIATNRLHFVRESIEDYELLHTLSQLYKNAGYEMDEVAQILYSTLYQGTQFVSDSKSVYNAKTQLMNLIELAQDGVFVSKLTPTYTGFIAEIVEVGGNTVSVKINEESITQKTVSDNKTIYSFVITMDKASTSLTISKNDVTFYFVLGGTKQVALDYNVEGVVGVANTINYTHEIVDASVVGETGKVEKVSFTNQAKKTVYIRPNNFKDVFGKNTSEITIEVYNPSTENIKVSLYFEGEVALFVNEYVLEPGKNVLKFNNVWSENWKVIKEGKGIRLLFAEELAVDTIYIGNIYTTGVAK